MLLAIDIGNTQIKLAVFEQNTIINKKTIPFSDWKKEVEITLINFSEIQYIVVASVGNLQKSDFLEFTPNVEVFFFSNESKFPFQNQYVTPSTLGIDRMVVAAGAVLKFPNQNRLIIDAGTCITYDFIDANDVYHGGAISPGIRLRYESLHNYTSNLPLLKTENPNAIIGNSTVQSIHSGVINGITLEIDGYMSSISNKNDNFIIILTGGDSEFLAERLKNTIFANPNFLLESLNQTFQYNQQ
ncbi:type III pantothenate kinase [Flavobacterium sp.]|uniref:type III pantothenate kinase n=1 Tax=Flavobacterium sp. TaxID=239 RepID=UPI003BC51E88